MEEKTLEFRDIFLEVKNEDKNIEGKYVRLLDGLSGKFKSGVLTAVMGASGAGKSTLFDVLLGRIQDSSKTYGTVLYNGEERKGRDWIHKVSYLKQDDIYFPKFTIMESIFYNLELYQPFTTKKAKIEFAEELLKRANIYDKRLAYIESLSGGERKRAMIALSMCSDPDVIFMDEPTSGLDSHSALTLINFMKTYAAEKNKIVIISLHQPGEALFNLFDEILYLGKGAVFYDGRIDDISRWLEEKGIPKLEGISLAEYLFELHSDNPYPPEIKDTRSIINQIIESNRQQYNEIRYQITLEQGISKLYFKKSFSFMAVFTLIRRFYLNKHRTYGLLKSLPIHAISVLIVVFVAHINGMIIQSTEIKSDNFDDMKSLNIINYMQTFCPSETKRYTSHFWFKISSAVQSVYFFFLYNFLDNSAVLLEDIYSGKYSVLSFFVAHLFHDTFISTYIFSLSFGVVFWTSFRHLINYWYFLYLSGFIMCYVINYMFVRILFSKPGESSKLVTSVYFFLAYLSVLDQMSLFYVLCNDYLPYSFKFIRYSTIIFTLFPQFLLKALFDYSNTQRVGEALKSGMDGDMNSPKVIIMWTDLFYSEDLGRFFRYFGGENLSFWAVVCIFFLSLLINIFGSLYFLNRKIRAQLRLNLKK